jgi:putative redox protein
MKIELKRVDNAFQFEAKSEFTNTRTYIDAAEAIGGHNAGARPMELMLMSLGGCSGIDVIEILKKQRQQLDQIDISVEGKRADSIPAVFTEIHLHFRLEGILDEKKVKRAIDLSLGKYCSAAAMLCKTAQITSSYEIRK